jgi:hypothetical protein
MYLRNNPFLDSSINLGVTKECISIPLTHIPLSPQSLGDLKFKEQGDDEFGSTRSGAWCRQNIPFGNPANNEK